MSSNDKDYKETLFLPNTNFPMRANLPEREKEWLDRWEKLNVYKKLRRDSKNRKDFVLHDGPPYANGNLHIGHALNKILKDFVVRSQQVWVITVFMSLAGIVMDYPLNGKSKRITEKKEVKRRCSDKYAS